MPEKNRMIRSQLKSPDAGTSNAMTIFSARLLAGALLLAFPASALAGQACYQRNTDTLESYITMNLPDNAADGPVSGTASGVIQDDAEGYYSSWQSTFSGTRAGKLLKLDVQTKIEDDDQTQYEEWRFVGKNIQMDDDRYEPVDCAVVEEKAAQQ